MTSLLDDFIIEEFHIMSPSTLFLCVFSIKHQQHRMLCSPLDIIPNHDSQLVPRFYGKGGRFTRKAEQGRGGTGRSRDRLCTSNRSTFMILCLGNTNSDSSWHKKCVPKSMPPYYY